MRWLRLVAWLIVLLLCAGTAYAQDEEYVPQDGEKVETVDGGEGGLESDLLTTSEEEEADFEEIDDLLLQDEEVLADPGTYTYDPGARRDPFRSLIQQREQAPSAPAERPAGIAGLLIDEIELQGVYVLDDGPVAQIMSASQETSFLLKVGQQLWDGEVVRINMDEVTFRQTVDDPTARKPFRDVVKKLNPNP